MIESETTIMMRCDKCGGVLIDDYGHIIRLEADSYAYAHLRQRAIDMGWKCEECLCPMCRKDAENETKSKVL